MTKFIRVTFTIFAIVLLFSACSVHKVTIKVVGEDGLPIEDAKVGMGFERNTGWSTDSSGRQGITGADGLFSATGSGNGHITYGARKEGYYPSYYDYDFKKGDPWNKELTVLLRKIINPVPMYARNAGMEEELIFPLLNKNIGFDLIKCDWVAPYGKGETADFVFNLKKNYLGRRDFSYSLTLKFAGKDDGIINVRENLYNGSVFKFPRIAPLSSYSNEIVFSHSFKNGQIIKSYNQEDSFIFKVRSDKFGNKGGSAMYGKIREPITVSGIKGDRPHLVFMYYLNPDGTRNLEFDTGKNLFKSLKMLEEVKYP